MKLCKETAYHQALEEVPKTLVPEKIKNSKGLKKLEKIANIFEELLILKTIH